MGDPKALSGGLVDVDVDVLGGGLAGCEAAFQLAERGARVRLHEMRPLKTSPAVITSYML